MTELSALWLPILLGAVVCFVASSIIHMTALWHKNEYPQLPDEEKARAAIGALNELVKAHRDLENKRTPALVALNARIAELDDLLGKPEENGK